MCVCSIQLTCEAGADADTTESDTSLSDVNRKRLLDSCEDLSTEVPRTKTERVDGEDITAD